MLKKIVPHEVDQQYPKCIEGRGACPLEDIGGIPEYYHFLQAIQNPNHEEHNYYMELIGGEKFNLNKFDLEKANKFLLSIKQKISCPI